MSGSFVVSLFEIFNYLIPGFLILLGIIVSSKTLQKLLSKDVFSKYGIGAIFIVLSFLLGIINHTVSSSVFTKTQTIIKISRVDDYINQFQNIEQVRVKVQRKLGVNKQQSNFSNYRYAYTYVKENSKGEINRIERLSALSLFCRNSVIPLFLLSILSVISLRRFYLVNNKSKWLLLIMLFIVSEAALIKAYDDFLIAKMIAILRTFLMLK